MKYYRSVVAMHREKDFFLFSRSTATYNPFAAISLRLGHVYV